MQVSFYQCSSNQEKTILGLATKAYQSRIPTLLLADASIGRGLDAMFWTTPRTGFLPHATCADPLPELQPLLITWLQVNQNNAECLIVALDYLFTTSATSTISPQSTELNVLVNFFFDFRKIMIVGTANEINQYVQNSLTERSIPRRIYVEQGGVWVE